MAKKVLIIDDSATQLNSLRIFFKRDGWEINTASDGLDAYMQVYKDPPDVIVSDIIMPNLTGFQFCRLLKSETKTKEIPIALLTVMDKQIDKFWAMECGADKFIRKNSDISEIVNGVKELSEEMSVSEDYKNSIKDSQISEESAIERINKILDQALMNATLINAFRSIVDYALSDVELAKKVFGILSTILEYDVAGLYFNPADKSLKRSFITSVKNINIDSKVADAIAQKLLGEECSSVEVFSDPKASFKVQSIEDFTSFTELEFKHQQALIGKICFYSRRQIEWEELNFIDTIKSELDLLFRLKYLYDSAHLLSLIDALTGLYTRRSLDETLEREFERAKRYHIEVSVAMADIDNFKLINDEYGHQVGDIVLKRVAEVFSTTLRKTDLIYRYGGEEILVIMPETPIENTIIPLERIREKVERLNLEFSGEKLRTTISMGVSTCTDKIEEHSSLIENADKALYRAKRSGKNRIDLADE